MDRHPDSAEPAKRGGPGPFNFFESALELTALGGILICALIVAINYASLPEQIPMHFNTSGVPNRYGSKAELWLVVGVVVLLCLTNGVIARFMHRFRRSALAAAVSTRTLLLTRKLVLLVNAELALLFVIALHQAVQVGSGAAEKLDNGGLLGMLILIGLTVAVYLLAVVRTVFMERSAREM